MNFAGLIFFGVPVFLYPNDKAKKGNFGTTEFPLETRTTIERQVDNEKNNDIRGLLPYGAVFRTSGKCCHMEHGFHPVPLCGGKK
jgi:hypothetical protein